MADVTVSQFAEVLKVPVERLLTQLDEAGIRVSGADDTISDDAKMELLTFLRRAHGRTQDSAAPRKITLQRKSQGEIKVASAQGRARMVNVEVRSKKTYLNRSVLEERARVQQEEVDRHKHEVERAKQDVESTKETREEDLLKQQRMEAEQREAEARQRLELEEEAKRRADEEARVAAEEEARRQAEARERQEAERRREQETAKVVRAPEREAPRAQRAELHVSSDASARFKKKKQHQASRSRRPAQINVSTQHGFERPAAPVKRDVQIGETVTVAELAQRMAVKANEVIKVMMNMGVMATINQPIDQDTAVLVVEELGHTAVLVKENAIEDELQSTDTQHELAARPPVVTVMGHVDHGKTSLLDYIRSTKVAAGEAGGITQHIGAYQVKTAKGVVTFLDTPGHEAFTAMRARGAQVTDIAVIVVAADDGVMPQTREAIDHAKAAEVPILVAVNKIDKEGAQPDRVRTEMTQLGLQPEEWGGETMFVDVSAKARTNLDELLESILLLAEVEELRANPDVEASGVVIESKLDPGRGAVVTVLVNRGTLKVGDAIVAGAHWGRVRALHDYRGRKVKEATPSEPVEVLGFDTVPEAGEYVRVVENDRKARQLAGERGFRLKSEAQARRSQRTRSLATIFEDARGGLLQDLNLVLKADVSGSLEAFEDEIAKLPQSEVQVQVVLSGVGGITESDIMLAAASDAIVLGFNVRPVGDARQVADREGVEIRTYSVIYRAIDELRDAMQGMLAPDEVEESVGTVEVRAIFRASRVGTIAGCYVTDGKVTRGAKARLVRDGTIVYDGQIASLRRVQDDVREVAAGFECGIVLQNYADIKEGDVIEVYATRQVERTLS